MSQQKQPSEETLEGLAYEKLIEELDGVVKILEGGELPLEESLRAFERGVRLAHEAERQLDRAEHRVELLLQGGKTQAFPQLPPGGGDESDS